MGVIKVKKSRLLLLSAIFLGLAINSSKANDVRSNGIDYPRAFKQDEIYKEFPELMRLWGCRENIANAQTNSSIQPPTNLLLSNSGYTSRALSYLGSKVGSTYSKAKYLCSRGIGRFRSGYMLLPQTVNYDNLNQQFRQKCLEKLFAEKRWNITAPARQGILHLAVTGLGSYLTTQWAGSDSFGASFSQFVAATNSAYILKDIFEVAFKLIWPPASELDVIEIEYAVDKCFIPSALWHKIEETFLLARSNAFEARNCINFIEFALGLTVYKPKTAFQNTLGSDEINQELDRRIDRFFGDYDTKSINLDLFKLKSGVHDFVKRLLDDSQSMPKYIHLHGKGGIGKTRFVRELCKWINELLPNGVNYEDATIEDTQDLEGNQQKPGILLKILRNQLQSGKQGSVVFMDEASWLNNPVTISAAKRVFNGDLTRIATHYFGSGIGGCAINLDMPPTLIFVASNEKIKDANLESRFINIEFPLPTQEALLRYAHKIFEDSNLHQKAVNLGKDQEIHKKLEQTIIESIEKTQPSPSIMSNQHSESKGAMADTVDTFRTVEQFTKPFVLKELEPK